MKKISIILWMLLLIFAFQFSSVSAVVNDELYIYYPGSVISDLTYEYDPSNGGSIKCTKGGGFNITNAQEGEYKIDFGTIDFEVSVKKNDDNEEAISFSKRYDLVYGDTLYITAKHSSSTVLIILSILPPTSTPGTAVPAVYIYPEDEYGLYYLLDDGKKEYIQYHSYDICLDFMGSRDKCEYYRR